MKLLSYPLTFLFFLSFACIIPLEAQTIEQDYIITWKKFYPSKALRQGMHDAIWAYEDRSTESIQAWQTFNQEMLKQLSEKVSSPGSPGRINKRLLKAQIQKELHLWETEKPQSSSLSFYTNLIDRTLNNVWTSNFLISSDKAALICDRLISVERLCRAGRNNLLEVRKEDLEKGLKVLQKNKQFYKEGLLEKLKKEEISASCGDLEKLIANTIKAFQQFETFLQEKVHINEVATNPILGRAEYARQLSQYVDMPYTPEQLAAAALEEIEATRQLIGEKSKAYIQETYPNRPAPKLLEEAIEITFADMEADAPANGAEYLKFWQDLSDAAIQFIEEKKIATLPEYQTLRIVPAPESAGPAARIGWVSSAPPFAPNPVTTLYLPNIPDDFPEEEKKDFWSSFNKPFNRMIVIHELFPGHYMQIKISRETAHPVRLLFPYGPYFEGWATLTERVALDHGWEAENPLTFIAHLRKRLENANRAYTSVQVHCNDWDQEKVMEFSTQQSLLAPQFAKSLWGRLMRSPMQMTSYFYGCVQFTDLLKSEKERLGDDFNLQLFMDTIMKVGPITIEEFGAIFRSSIPD
ncbi:MAG: DUF885 family protein [Bacteroidota bacterium]